MWNSKLPILFESDAVRCMVETPAFFANRLITLRSSGGTGQLTNSQHTPSPDVARHFRFG